MCTEFYQKMDQLEEQLEKDGFFRIHQSYIKLFANATFSPQGTLCPIMLEAFNRS